MYSLIEKRELKTNKGITLITLVVTIIILLILAGISIGMLSGDNSIIKQAGDAKEQTDIAQEKVILEQATVVCMGKNKYGNIEETDLKKELENVAEVIMSGSKFKVTFPSERQYLIDQEGNVKEKIVSPNAMEISELNEKASTYFGWDVINYAETLPENLQDTEWQLFYAGALDGETEERIYLISKGYVKNTVLPSKNGIKPIAKSNSNYTARLGTDSTGIKSQYNGSMDIDLKLQRYNKKYFDFLNGDTSTNSNMKAVAYMMDIDIWHNFATSAQGYAEYAIGGPTLEMLFVSYNKYSGKTENDKCTSRVISKKGYQISKDGGATFADEYNAIMENNTSSVNNPYSTKVKSIYYITASPSNFDTDNVLLVSSDGNRIIASRFKC